MSDLASCIKHVWFVNETCAVFPLRNKLCSIFFIHRYFNSFKMKEATSLPLLPAASIFQLPSGVRPVSMNSLLQPLSPRFPHCYLRRGLCDSPFAHNTNASQFRQVESLSAFINSRLSTLRRNRFNNAPAENSKEYKVIERRYSRQMRLHMQALTF